MATKDEVLAKAAEWEAAGNSANAAKLRAYADTLPEAKPAPDRAAVEAKAVEWEKAGNAANAAKLREYAKTLAPPQAAGGPDVNAMLGMTGRRADAVDAAPYSTPAKPDTFGETAKAMTEGPMAAAGQFAGGLTGSNPSPARAFLANDPLTGMLPGPVLTGLGILGDVAGAGLSTVGAGIGGALGLGAELVPGQNSAQEQKLAEDLSGMAMFAVPELAGASSIPARMASAAPRIAEAAPVAKSVVKTQEEVNALAKKAASGGMGSVKAQEALAAEAKLNPEAKAAAERLGIDLPSDVFSDNDMLKATVGLTRSEVGKEAEALWKNAVKGARDKADEIMSAMDGSSDIASVSDAVKGSLQATRDGLKATAKELYKAVDAAVPKSAKANVTNMVQTLNGVIEDMGGVSRLSPDEKRIFGLVTGNEPLTYGALIREKNIIGEALGRGQSPYPNMAIGDAKRVYGAMADDQLATVSSLGDDTLRAKLREANQLTAKQKALEKRIVTAFGSDLDGSIGSKLRSAVKTAATGDIAGLTRILKVIPDDLRKSAMASAITSVSRSARATEPGFGLPEFAKLFDGITANKPVANLIGNTLGGEAMKVLKDLHTVARRVVQSDANVLRTGKANQIYAMNQADGVIGKVLESTAGKRLTKGAAIGGASMVSGPVGGVLAGALTDTLMAATPDVLAKMSKLFASPEFEKLMIEAAQGAPKPATISALNASPAFRGWSVVSGIKDAKDLTIGVAPRAAPQAAAQSIAAPDYEPLWQRYGGGAQ